MSGKNDAVNMSLEGSSPTNVSIKQEDANPAEGRNARGRIQHQEGEGRRKEVQIGEILSGQNNHVNMNSENSSPTNISVKREDFDSDEGEDIRQQFEEQRFQRAFFDGGNQGMIKQEDFDPEEGPIDLVDETKTTASSSNVGNNDPESAVESALQTLLRVDATTLSDNLKEKIISIQKMFRIPCPLGIDEAVFRSLPEDMQKEYSQQVNAADDQEQILQAGDRKKRRRRAELARMSDHTKAGVRGHGHAPAAAVGGAAAPQERLAKHVRAGKRDHVVREHWSRSAAGCVPARPHHYCRVPDSAAAVAHALRRELQQRAPCELLHRVAGGGSRAKSENPYEVHPGSGYYKAHMSDKLIRHFQSQNILPPLYQIKESAQKKGIVFSNESDGMCDCHFDRDSAVLVLWEGYKEVKIAPPIKDMCLPGDGILPWKPFDPNKALHGDIHWESVNMVPGDVSDAISLSDLSSAKSKRQLPSLFCSGTVHSPVLAPLRQKHWPHPRPFVPSRVSLSWLRK